MTFQEVIQLILGNLGALGLCLVILYGGYKKWWVFGWYAKEQNSRIERLENRIDTLSTASKTATANLTRVVDIAEKQQEAASA